MLQTDELVAAIKEVRSLPNDAVGEKVLYALNVAERFAYGNVTTDERIHAIVEVNKTIQEYRVIIARVSGHEVETEIERIGHENLKRVFMFHCVVAVAVCNLLSKPFDSIKHETLMLLNPYIRPDMT